MADTAKKKTAEVYYVENVVRKVGTRLHRAKSPTRHRFKLFIAGQRLIRGQKIPLTPAQFQKEEKKIHEMVLAGQLALYLPDGMRITSTHTGDMIYTRADGAVKVVKQSDQNKAPTKRPIEEVSTKEELPPQNVPVEAPKEMFKDKTVADAKATPPQDLTVLPNIGAGRARKLEAKGVSNYYQVVELGVSGLMELLGVTEEVAEEIVEKATELS